MNLPRLAAAAALSVAALTACDYTHPNGCVEFIGNPAADGTLRYERVTGEPDPMGAWIHKTTGLVHLWAQQEDGRTWRTVECADLMPVYP